ncbi:head-tail connector protein [Butyricimonas synergistica]|uniref:head-tail connector protein n=1 Tax=Butyricimonas synergistica TaxID=544644 RepID=UPI0022DFD506|nr:head-tail connector protein [Butyricimonas synergistica]
MKVKRLSIGLSPVTLERAKEHLRVMSSDFDNNIRGLLEAAITAAENYTGLKLREYEYSVTGDFARVIKTGIMPIKEVLVRVDGSEVDNVDWEDSAVILLDTCAGSKIDIKITTGFDIFPDDITAAILLITGKLFENPADSVENLPKASSNLLNAYKRWGR